MLLWDDVREHGVARRREEDGGGGVERRKREDHSQWQPRAESEAEHDRGAQEAGGDEQAVHGAEEAHKAAGTSLGAVRMAVAIRMATPAMMRTSPTLKTFAAMVPSGIANTSPRNRRRVPSWMTVELFTVAPLNCKPATSRACRLAGM